MNIISAVGLSKAFQSSVFQNLNLTVSQSEKLCILGPSGCGKSTLLRIISGLDKQFEGSLQLQYNRAGMVFQEPRLLPWKTTEENILLPFELDPRLNSKEKPAHGSIEKWIQIVNLKEHRKKFPAELSGGMKMRASLARALITDPSILFLDEPLSALDESTRHRLQALIWQLAETNKMTMVFVTHSLSEALFMGDRILVMNRRGEFSYETKVIAPSRDDVWRYSKDFQSQLLTLSEKVKKVFDE